MYLTPDEEKSLFGEHGEALQAATSLLVDVGEFFNAEKLISVASAHISGVSYLAGGDGLIDQLELFVNKNAKVSVPSTLNPCGMDRKNWESIDSNIKHWNFFCPLSPNLSSTDNSFYLMFIIFSYFITFNLYINKT